MSDRKSTESKSIIDPVSRSSEILFGLIMVLTFTCSLSVAEVGREDVREMLIGALGCNIAWGIIDAFFYLISTLTERGRALQLARKLKTTTNPDSARALIEETLPEPFVGSLSATSISEIQTRLAAYSEKNFSMLTFGDIRGAILIFMLVFLSTFPVAVPFMLLDNPAQALRLSNCIALFLLFVIGLKLGHYAGRRGWVWGFIMMVIGACLVWITIALGG